MILPSKKYCVKYGAVDMSKCCMFNVGWLLKASFPKRLVNTMFCIYMIGVGNFVFIASPFIRIALAGFYLFLALSIIAFILYVLHEKLVEMQSVLFCKTTNELKYMDENERYFLFIEMDKLLVHFSDIDRFYVFGTSYVEYKCIKERSALFSTKE